MGQGRTVRHSEYPDNPEGFDQLLSVCDHIEYAYHFACVLEEARCGKTWIEGIGFPDSIAEERAFRSIGKALKTLLAGT